MLKIYLRRTKFELHNNDEFINLGTWHTTCIKDEAEAISETTEFGAYTKDAEKAYFDCEFTQKKKGMRVIYWKRDGCVILKQWLAPDAKLIRYRTYEEYSCSMKELMTLPAADVIVYLKQEGLSFNLTN